MYMHLHILLSIVMIPSLPPSLPPSGGGQDTMVSSQVQYYVKSSDLKKKKHLEGHVGILHSGEEL